MYLGFLLIFENFSNLIYLKTLIFLLSYFKQKYLAQAIFFFIKNISIFIIHISIIMIYLKKNRKTLFKFHPRIVIVHVHIHQTKFLTVDKRRNYSFHFRKDQASSPTYTIHRRSNMASTMNSEFVKCFPLYWNSLIFWIRFDARAI